MNMAEIGNMIVNLIIILDTLAIYFLINRVSTLEKHDEQNTNTIKSLDRRITNLSTKLKALVDKE